MVINSQWGSTMSYLKTVTYIVDTLSKENRHMKTKKLKWQRNQVANSSSMKLVGTRGRIIAPVLVF